MTVKKKVTMSPEFISMCIEMNSGHFQSDFLKEWNLQDDDGKKKLANQVDFLEVLSQKGNELICNNINSLFEELKIER